MTTNSATDDTDESKGKSGLVSRREAMALIAAGAGSATLAGAATSDTSGNTGLGGGPMSEPGRRADLYDVHADDEIPDPVQGRYLRIVDDRADWDAGDLLEARDNEWHPINLGVGSLNAEDLVSKGTPWFDLRSFGAESGTNVTTEWNEAYDAISAEGGGNLYVPNGNWTIDPVDIPNNVTHQFQSINAVVIADAQADEQWSLFDTPQASPENIWFIGPGKIDGNSAAHAHPKGDNPNKGDIIEPEGLDGGGIVRMTIDDAPADAIDLDEGDNVTVKDCTVTGAGGWGIHNSVNQNGARIINNHVEVCGFEIERGGIDQGTSAANGTYVGNTAIDNYQNYDVRGDAAEWAGNKSRDTGAVVEADDLQGVQTRTESGLETFGGQDASLLADDGWGSFEEQEITVSFDSPFPSAPNVSVTGSRDAGHTPTMTESAFQVRDVRVDQFRIWHLQYVPNDRSTETVAVEWTAQHT